MKIQDPEKLLDKFYKEYNNNNYKQAIKWLNEFIDLERKVSFWDYSRLSSCYYELQDYETALLYAKRAYSLKPKSPLVLWDYAGVLIMVKKEKKAIKLLQRIQNMEDDLTVYGFADPDKKWMRSLKNDANFLIGKAYYLICEDQLAKHSFQKHLSQRGKGLKSIYSKKQGVDYIKKIESTMSMV